MHEHGFEAGTAVSSTHSAQGQARMGGFYMEPPTPEEARHFMRSLPYEQRLSIIANGFHRGPSTEHCYRFEEFVQTIAKREYNNPAGGVRVLNREKLVAWTRDAIGDDVLAHAIDDAFERGVNMVDAVDMVRLIVFVRLGQYDEVLADAEEQAVAEPLAAPEPTTTPEPVSVTA